MRTMFEDSMAIVRGAIEKMQPGAAVERALAGRSFSRGRLLVVSVGKAAWTMADAARRVLGARVDGGVVITKYSHSRGPIAGLTVFEAGHPVPDENSYRATREALAVTEGLSKDDTVLLLLSGGGSALFEAPLVPPEELADLTRQLLASGADIVEMNTVRKRFSGVKGGRFAAHCAPASVFSVVLSDVIGDPLDMIASGPACPDGSTAADAKAIADKYGLRLTPRMRELLDVETPKTLTNAQSVVTGSVRLLCAAAAEEAERLGYAPEILTDSLDCEAREAGAMLAAIARYRQGAARSLAIIAGGETVVHVTGKGLGGRNQELALSAARGIAGLRDTAVFSVGSDGTDGPTDAAGGYADGDTAAKLEKEGVSIYETLQHNDAYHALSRCGGLIVTGPTGTNVNDVSVLLIRRV